MTGMSKIGYLAFQPVHLSYLDQETLTEGEGSVHLTSSLRYIVLEKVNNIFIIKMSWSKLFSTRRSTALSIPLQ
jgi:hypothetical protein